MKYEALVKGWKRYYKKSTSEIWLDFVEHPKKMISLREFIKIVHDYQAILFGSQARSKSSIPIRNHDIDLIAQGNTSELKYIAKRVKSKFKIHFAHDIGGMSWVNLTEEDMTIKKLFGIKLLAFSIDSRDKSWLESLDQKEQQYQEALIRAYDR